MSRIMNNICRGHTLRIAIGITILALQMVGGAGATTISSCTKISSPGEYVLDRDIFIISSSTIHGCIFINSSNVIFDGAGFTISTDNSSNLLGFISGVDVDGSTAPNGVYTENRLTNITVKNLNLKNWKIGITYHNITEGTIGNINSTNNDFFGIALEQSSSDNTISGNIVKFNGYSGINLDFSSNNNTISGNIANSNFLEGIAIDKSSNNTISGNTANSNTDPIVGGGEGIHLDEASNNTISGNIVKFNGDEGIDLDVASNNTISDNIVNLNGNKKFGIIGEGIGLVESRNNTISGNNITSNFGQGINLLFSESNLIYNNFFNNTENALDTGNNTWNITKMLGTNIIGGPYLGGNFWSDYTGKDTDGDGLGDTMIPYNSSGNITHGGDYLPLTQVGVVVGSIHGTKFNDVNGNKIRDAGEPGLAGWHIKLVGVDTLTMKPVNREEITDTNGNYGFTDVNPGIYQVFEVMQGPNWVPTTPVTVPIVNKTAIMGINVNFGNKQIP